MSCVQGAQDWVLLIRIFPRIKLIIKCDGRIVQENASQKHTREKGMEWDGGGGDFLYCSHMIKSLNLLYNISL